ncbi:Uncharacterized membrane protein [Chitinophaga costaii]|uniref:Uncharacterized membrane protein n=1 Tax=Chitinophaga costaii TaxID=1335309 RepID=A0A1C4G7F3_9BACT|nr:DUF1634 domain-containing protein [Chitinophaga costaii]PUZ19433.1 DUF1634 domain-containing protein [Chitinophaga costaii]SCC64148.1 Uncharacterized membrane protein [Chitinophaga costaii]
MKRTSKRFLVDHDIEQIIGWQLRLGVITASVIVGIGGLLYLMQSGRQARPPYHQFLGTAAGFTTLKEILTGMQQGDAKAYVQLGVVILILTPIFRIAFSLVGFVLEKDRLYICITLIVLAVMMISIFGGLKV